MFDVALSELGLVGIVAVFVLGPKDLIKVVKQLNSNIAGIKQWLNRYIQYLTDGISETTLIQKKQEITNYIVDLEGNLQITYDLTDIKPEIDQT